MKDDRITPQEMARFDAYLEQLTQKKLSAMYEKAQSEFRLQAAERHRLPPHLQPANDDRIKQFMVDVAAGTPYTKPIITNLWASLGSIAAPTGPQQLAGWGTSTPPESYFFNFFYNMVETYLLHINQYGICVWDNATDYPIGGLSRGSDAAIYRSIASPNVNHDPTLDGGVHWVSALNDGCSQVSLAGTFSVVSILTPTVVPFDTVDFDTSGWWSASNKAFIPTKPGKYSVIGALKSPADGVAAQSLILGVLLNGVIYKAIDIRETDTAHRPFVTGSCAVPANGTTDQIKLYAEIDTSAPETFGGEVATCYFSLSYAGA